MKQFILKNKHAITGISVAILLGVVTLSFQDSPVIRQKFDVQQSYDDTVPEKINESSMKMKDLDKLAIDLDKTLLEVGTELKKIDFAVIQNDVEKALKDVDMQKIMNQADLAIKSIDLDKIMADVKSSLKNVDWDKKSGEINEAMQEAKKEIEKASSEVKNLDKDVIEKALAETRKELEKTKLEIKNIDMDKIMTEARQGIDKAKEELRQIKAMFTEMEKDGLIDTKAGFSVEYKDKDLYINGKKQPASVTDKYRKYFKDEHFKMNIGKEQ
jgi:hypothetical protein